MIAFKNLPEIKLSDFGIEKDQVLALEECQRRSKVFEIQYEYQFSSDMQ